MPSTDTRAHERGSAVAATLGLLAALTGLATAVLGIAPAMRPWSFSDVVADTASASSPTPSVAPRGGSHDVESGTPTSIALDTESGAGGTRLHVSGEGFGAGELVVVHFDTDEAARTTADERGRFSDVVLRVPTDYVAFAPAPFTVSATGAETARGADATFRLTG